VSGHCGACSACIDACPTRAIVGTGQVDARRCISYLTIEHPGPIPEELRPLVGNRIYGCDDCLAVCPWNKYAERTKDYAFLPRAELSAPRLADLARLDEATFRAVFSGSPIKRIGRDRFVRNVLIAIGNAGDASLATIAEERAADPSPLVRAMAAWALGRLMAPESFAALRERELANETDESVRAEWLAAA
jgi:epoxyqueuosine reductase